MFIDSSIARKIVATVVNKRRSRDATWRSLGIYAGCWCHRGQDFGDVVVVLCDWFHRRSAIALGDIDAVTVLEAALTSSMLKTLTFRLNGWTDTARRHWQCFEIAMQLWLCHVSRGLTSPAQDCSSVRHCRYAEICVYHAWCQVATIGPQLSIHRSPTLSSVSNDLVCCCS